MSGSAPFRLNRSGMMLALVSAAFAAEAGAAAGRAEFVIGKVTVAGRDNIERPLTRGTELDNGDTIRTNDGRAQIRFTDGAYVSLQPDTEFGIRQYLYENKTDGSETGFFGLLKGAMRTVTGAIGRINRDRYQITTPTATVGIRGTGGLIQVLIDGVTLVYSSSGVWSLANPAGAVDVPAGTSAMAPTDPNQPPSTTTQQPTSGPAPIVPTEITNPEPPLTEPFCAPGDQTCQELTDTIVPPPSFNPLVSGSGYHLVSAFNTSTFEGIVLTSAAASASFNGAGQMLEANTTHFSQPLRSTLLPGGSHADFGTDGILAWGRWIGPTEHCNPNCFSQDVYSPNEGYHYVIGTPTPVLPTTGGGTYTLIGATRPTYQFDNGVAPGTFTGTLGVTFSAVASVTANFNVSMPDGKSFDLVGTNSSIRTANWSITPTVTGNFCCVCSGQIEGFFAGPNAERAGVGYHISDGIFSNIVGAAAFKKP